MKCTWAFLIFAVFFASCSDNSPTPRPVGYFRIDFPEHAYIEKTPNCPFTIETSHLSRLEYYTEDTNSTNCWFDISYPRFKAKIHLTYKPIDNNLRQYLEEARGLAFEHQIKAARITQTPLVRESDNVYGLIFDLGGNVASPMQFYITDSVSHFVRGSLYFEAKPNPDSISPVLNFIRQDIDHFMATFGWK